MRHGQPLVRPLGNASPGPIEPRNGNFTETEIRNLSEQAMVSVTRAFNRPHLDTELQKRDNNKEKSSGRE